MTSDELAAKSRKLAEDMTLAAEQACDEQRFQDAAEMLEVAAKAMDVASAVTKEAALIYLASKDSK